MRRIGTSQSIGRRRRTKISPRRKSAFATCRLWMARPLNHQYNVPEKTARKMSRKTKTKMGALIEKEAEVRMESENTRGKRQEAKRSFTVSLIPRDVCTKCYPHLVSVAAERSVYASHEDSPSRTKLPKRQGVLSIGAADTYTGVVHTGIQSIGNIEWHESSDVSRLVTNTLIS